MTSDKAGGGKEPKKTMREKMPPRYIPTLMERTGLKKLAVIRAVKNESRRSKAWPHIVQLAKEYEEQLRDEENLGSSPAQK